nr:uncharacterized protein LOC124213660 [Neodiprion pinetum]
MVKLHTEILIPVPSCRSRVERDVPLRLPSLCANEKATFPCLERDLAQKEAVCNVWNKSSLLLYMRFAIVPTGKNEGYHGVHSGFAPQWITSYLRMYKTEEGVYV